VHLLYVYEHIPPSTNLFPISFPRFVQVAFQHKYPCRTQTLKRCHLLLAPPKAPLLLFAISCSILSLAAFPSDLNMETAGPSETSITNYKIALRHIP